MDTESSSSTTESVRHEMHRAVLENWTADAINRLTQARKLQRLSLLDIGSRANMDPSRIQALLTGSTKHPRVDTLQRIAAALHVTLPAPPTQQG